VDALSAEPEHRGRADERIQQLERDLADAIERESAAGQVLEVIGRSAFELEPAFEAVLQQAVRLCKADAGLIYVLDDDVYRMAFALGASKEYRDYVEGIPIVRGHGTIVGRVGLTRSTVHVRDVLADPDYELHQARKLGGFRTMLGVPMVVDGRVVGVIILWREEVEPFDERTIDLVTTFAAQGAIAIQNAQLFQALQRRERELNQSVEELHALGETSQAVSSTLDLQQVLTTIVTRAVELSGTEGGSIFEFDPATRCFRLRTCYGTSEELEETLRATAIELDGTFLGRAAAAGEARQAPDLDHETPDPHIDALRRTGWRSMLAVPLLSEEKIIGALVVRRTVPGPVRNVTIQLMETLASQSAVAIHHARLFRELEEKSRELEVAGRHKSEFLASMSHELRTPLNAVIGFSDVLLEQMFGELNDRQDAYIRDIRDSGRHLLELINEILDLSRIEAGRMELEVAPFSLAELMEHGLAMVRERATQHRITVSLDVAPEVGIVWGDELKLKQVVLNLLTNAVKFTRDGGSVEAMATVVGEEARVTVRDTGIGIAEDEQERIFEAFQRGGRSPQASAEGTGLGLTLSKRIVELHGGRLWMKSRLGAGSTFGFSIPVRNPQTQPQGAATGERSEGAPGADTGGMLETVLVVEDDPHSAELLALYLEGAGYRTVLARDGVEGLELARRLRPSAVVLDIVLPSLDGWGLLARLKADAATASCPVVIVSMLDQRGKGFALGAADYLVKPVERDEMLGALARCIPGETVPRTVLVIDDDARDRRLVADTLEPEGYSVLTAEDGEEGVELVRRERPAVVLLDLLMPGLDGFAVVDELRADPSTADVPIVVLTAKDLRSADRERLAGRISYLAEKGAFGRSELIALVRSLARPSRPPMRELL
jgi:signal transduction histidine kinase/CheY-like chemotaxis protein/putative methionine-R-sulfoxide reductase with GAF domain